MTKAEIQIEVLCALTKDPEPLVREVINLIRKVIPGTADTILDEPLSAVDSEKLRRDLMNDDTLITWYKQGLRHRHRLKQ